MVEQLLGYPDERIRLESIVHGEQAQSDPLSAMVAEQALKLGARKAGRLAEEIA